MRILCIDHEGGFGGSSRSLFYLVKELKKRKIDIDIYLGKDGPIKDKYKDINVKVFINKNLPSCSTVFRLSRNIFSLLMFFFNLFKNFNSTIFLIKQINKNYDLIHFNHPNLYLYSAVLKLFTNKPFIFHIMTSLENLYEGNSISVNP